MSTPVANPPQADANDSAPLTGPLGACCTRTVPHAGVARGTVETIAGLETYVSRPFPGPGCAGTKAGDDHEEGEGDSERRVILFFADVFGPLYINSKLAMDYWAAHGYLVLGVDYFEGDSSAHHQGEPGWDVDEWVVPFRTSAARITPPWIEAVREKYAGPNTTFFTVGYCFGGPFVMDLLADDWVTAGAMAHPAFLDEGHFRRLKQPLLISSPEDDFTFPSPARRRAEDIMAAQKSTYYIQIFSGAFHGFATRPDPRLRAERWAKEESASAVLRWFDHHAAAAAQYGGISTSTT
ncbi:alpha/beta-hydrolase [Trametes coccinea BRFM310]|uniref:Alpha/beta-hydrolase n=1 Tax=Trametes coccinea (strain BRFM310) TaxID=1353009 RepID=A0A1Y2IJ40_TRAC3|nr:alpha/beta-hydrolase [Trametes coccinea BRFM310]